MDIYLIDKAETETDNTGSYQLIDVEYDGTYTVTAQGAAGQVGSNNRSGTIYNPVPGHGAVVTTTVDLVAGDQLLVVVGKRGKTTVASTTDGSGGGGGGATWVFKKVASVSDETTEIAISGVTGYWRLICVAAGGNGTVDGAYKSSNATAKDAYVAALYSKSNWVASSTTTGSVTSAGATGGVLSLAQLKQYGFNGRYYTRGSNTGYGGYGCGSAQDDSEGYGGGWSAVSSAASSFAYGGGSVAIATALEGGKLTIWADIDITPPEDDCRHGEPIYLDIQKDGDYTLWGRGASGGVGTSYNPATNTYITSTPGRGAEVATVASLKAGDRLMIIVGKQGGGHFNETATGSGVSGGSGGATWIFKKISSITDERYQIAIDGQPWELLLCAAGGNGTPDALRNGAQIANSASSTLLTGSVLTTASASKLDPGKKGTISAVLSLTQIATYGFDGTYSSNNKDYGYGGYGCGSVADGVESYGAGWNGGPSATNFALNGGTAYITAMYGDGLYTIHLIDSDQKIIEMPVIKSVSITPNPVKTGMTFKVVTEIAIEQTIIGATPLFVFPMPDDDGGDTMEISSLD